MEQQRITEIKQRLDAEYPDRKPLLHYKTPFELLVAVSLAAQTTDAAVNKITPELFARWGEPGALANADIEELEALVHSLGFFRTKAKNLIAASRKLIEDFAGDVPRSMDDLVSLPGIGRKSANVIRAHIWNKPGIIVDTHFGRVCRRLGLTRETDPVKVEKEIGAKLPEKWQMDFSMTVNFHGRRYCKARKPECEICPLSDLCPRIGL